MTTLGHSLTGLSIGVLCMPGGRKLWWYFLFLNLFVALPNIPDWPFPGWGHDRYDISHSIFVTVLLIGIACTVFAYWEGGRRFVGGWRTLVCGGLTWISHLLLDSIYNHGQGLEMFWPVSDASLALPLPWFATLKPTAYTDEHNSSVLLIELAVYGTLLVLSIAARTVWWRRTRALRGTG
jgi:hypothetical protein